MAQHDFNIANQSGANVRTDLNNAIAALVTKSSGTTAPSSTFPFMWWVDTSGSYSVLKIRNAADTAWLTIGRLDVQALGLRALQNSNAEPSSPLAFEQWIDTNGSFPILKIRNAANTSWITVGRVDQANLGLMPLSGGTFTAFVSWSNTDYIKLPAGTTAQRPGSPVVGMLRYNSDLSSFEGYNGSWGPLGGSGGAGSLSWEKIGDLSPVNNSQDGIKLEGFSSDETQELYLTVNVPQSYVAGLQIKLQEGAFFCSSTSGNVRFRAQTALIRAASTVLGTYSNIHTSSNSSVAVPGTSNQLTSTGTIELTDSTGKINGVSVAPGDKLRVRLYRDIANEGTSASGYANLMINNLNVTFN